MNDSWGMQIIEREAAWQYSKGEDIHVVVLDSGIDRTHPDLLHVHLAADFSQSINGPMDQIGHGTHVAGIIGANGKLKGVAPNVKLSVGKIIHDRGTGSNVALEKGIKWAVRQQADVIHLSMGSEKPLFEKTKQVIDEAMLQGVFIVAAAGNHNKRVSYPACLPGVIGVGASQKNEAKWPKSNYGEAICLVAPGDDIESTYLHHGYHRMSGTSMAAAFVTGSIALYLSYLKANHEPRPTHDQLRKRLMDTAYQAHASAPNYTIGAGRLHTRFLFEKK